MKTSLNIKSGRKNYEIYISPCSALPNIIQEIGRLREITQEVGEGTNKPTDLDEYDIYYNHLFIWDKESKMIVEIAYRIGKGDEIFYSFGKRGFYLNELFKIKEEFYPVLQQSMELGRSWIRKEYQQKPLPLFLLWKGILKYPD